MKMNIKIIKEVNYYAKLKAKPDDLCLQAMKIMTS